MIINLETEKHRRTSACAFVPIDQALAAIDAETNLEACGELNDRLHRVLHGSELPQAAIVLLGLWALLHVLDPKHTNRAGAKALIAQYLTAFAA
jgi:hypothetical protein